MTVAVETSERTFADTYLGESQRELVHRTARLARSGSRRAPRTTTGRRRFRCEDFDDLFAAGLHAPTRPARARRTRPRSLSRRRLHALDDDEGDRQGRSLARPLLGRSRQLARAARRHGHDEQKARWFEGVVERGETWVAWSGEPQSRAPGETQRFGTYVERVDGGCVIDGNKAFRHQRRRRALGDPARQHGRSRRRAPRQGDARRRCC